MDHHRRSNIALFHSIGIVPWETELSSVAEGIHAILAVRKSKGQMGVFFVMSIRSLRNGDLDSGGQIDLSIEQFKRLLLKECFQRSLKLRNPMLTYSRHCGGSGSKSSGCCWVHHILEERKIAQRVAVVIVAVVASKSIVAAESIVVVTESIVVSSKAVVVAVDTSLERIREGLVGSGLLDVVGAKGVVGSNRGRTGHLRHELLLVRIVHLVHESLLLLLQKLLLLELLLHQHLLLHLLFLKLLLLELKVGVVESGRLRLNEVIVEVVAVESIVVIAIKAHLTLTAKIVAEKVRVVVIVVVLLLFLGTM